MNCSMETMGDVPICGLAKLRLPHPSLNKQQVTNLDLWGARQGFSWREVLGPENLRPLTSFLSPFGGERRKRSKRLGDGTRRVVWPPHPNVDSLAPARSALRPPALPDSFCCFPSSKSLPRGGEGICSRSFGVRRMVRVFNARIFRRWFATRLAIGRTFLPGTMQLNRAVLMCVAATPPSQSVSATPRRREPWPNRTVNRLSRATRASRPPSATRRRSHACLPLHRSGLRSKP
jgi:hypothetical protein